VSTTQVVDVPQSAAVVQADLQVPLTQVWVPEQPTALLVQHSELTMQVLPQSL